MYLKYKQILQLFAFSLITSRVRLKVNSKLDVLYVFQCSMYLTITSTTNLSSIQFHHIRNNISKSSSHLENQFAVRKFT